MLRMRPDQRHGAAGGTPEKQFPLGNILAVPDLLRQQAAAAGRGLQRCKQASGFLRPPGGQLVMRPLTSEERPQPANSSAIEWRAVRMLAVAIIVVAIPIGARRQFAPEQEVNRLDGVENARIGGGAKAEPQQRESIGADQKAGFKRSISIRPVSNRNQSVRPRIGIAR